MIGIHELFEVTLSAAFEQVDSQILRNSTSTAAASAVATSLLCPIVHSASALMTTAAGPYDNEMCRSISSPLYTPVSPHISNVFASQNASEIVYSASPTLSSFPYPSFLSLFFSRHEPLLFCNFDINPNTSVFSLTFLAAFILQITGFFLFRYFVPQLSKHEPKNRRGLSWVLTLFSSIVLFTGTFTLSSNMQWIPFYASSLAEGGIGENQRTATLLSLRHFPRESDVATMYSAYFVSYLICDLLLGVIYYRAYLDPLSGWFHHLGYLGVVSNAALQKNVSTLFAIGTPIEVSTIFLASGHVFPKLRSDFLFATSFFLSRIVYPIVLLPELYLNVESRLCWKVSLMALMVHIHWFRKFVQQQIRYYQDSLQKKSSEQSQEPKPVPKRDDVVIYECPAPAITTVVPNIQVAVTSKKMAESPRNDMSDMDEALANAAEVNGSRRQRRPNVIRHRSRPSFEHSIDSLCDDDESEDMDNDTITALATTNGTEAPAKTMKQLLDECEQEEFSYPLRVGTGNNKTFSAAALKKLMQGQGSNLGSSSEHNPIGVMRLSRASSMRDSKRRIALDAVRFEGPQGSLQQATPKSVIFEGRGQEQEQLYDSGEATVVLRRRPSRTSVAMANPTVTTTTENFGTTRMTRGVAVQA